MPITPSDKRRESIFVPDLEESPLSIGLPKLRGQRTMPDQSLDKLNEFLTYRDVSPVRHKLSVLWDDAHKRTKCRYTSKAKESIREVLEVIAPGQSKKLWAAVADNVQAERSQAEIELLEALAESYFNASHWCTRRQILSIMADKIPLKELQHYIPGVTSYRFNIARHHKLLHGRGTVVPIDVARCMKVDYAQVDYFLNFIPSSHVVQDLPFGEKCWNCQPER